MSARKRLFSWFGMTLVEIVLSILILGIVTGAILGAFIVARYSVAKAKHRVAAINLIAGKIEEVMATPYISVEQANFLPQTVTIDDRGTADALDDLTGTRAVTITEMAPGIDGYKKVLTVVSWTERGWGGSTDLSERLVTYVVRE